jgi:hypothetical protein
MLYLKTVSIIYICMDVFLSTLCEPSVYSYVKAAFALYTYVFVFLKLLHILWSFLTNFGSMECSVVCACACVLFYFILNSMLHYSKVILHALHCFLHTDLQMFPL